QDAQGRDVQGAHAFGPAGLSVRDFEDSLVAGRAGENRRTRKTSKSAGRKMRSLQSHTISRTDLYNLVWTKPMVKVASRPSAACEAWRSSSSLMNASASAQRTAIVLVRTKSVKPAFGPLINFTFHTSRFRLRDHTDVLNGSTEGPAFSIAVMFPRCD